MADCQSLFSRASFGKSIEANAETLDLIHKLRMLESQAQVEEEQIDHIKQTLMQTMADAEVLTYLGKAIITWKAPKPSYRIDTKRLSLDHPELIAQYQSPIQSSRRFVVKDYDLPPDSANRSLLHMASTISGARV